MKDLDTIFIAVNVSAGPRPKRNNERAFMRYEFLESLPRIAMAKYVKNGKMAKVADAMKQLLEEFVLPRADYFDINSWRWSRLYNEKCDDIFKNNKVQIQALFDMYSGREALPGEKPFMSIGEFGDLLNASGLMDDGFTAREVTFGFIRAEQTVIDEVLTYEDQKMRFLEFIDALGQIAEYKQFEDISSV